MHERREHGHGHGSSASLEDQVTGHAAGKTTLTQGIAPAEPGTETPGDPVAALQAKVQTAALAGHARHALQLLATVSRPVQAQIAAAIGPEARKALARNLPTSVGDSPTTNASSEIVFEATPDGELDTLELLFEARFRLKIGDHPKAKHGREFDALGLRRMWTVLKALPPGHVAHDWAVAKLDRYHDTQDHDPDHAHGLFDGHNGKAGEIDISYEDSIITDGGTTDHDKKGDPLHGVNRFDEVARHEVGHAVDRELGWVSFSTLCLTPEAGEWQEYWDPPTYQIAAEQMVTGSNGPIHRLPPTQRTQVIDAMVQSMQHSDTIHFRNAIDKLDGFGHLKGDPVYHVMTQGLASHNPWLSTRAIAGRHYHQGYKGTGKGKSGADWVSYSEKAYANHRVSEYQFRAIQEWFAEAYAAFYTPVAHGQPKGAKLKGKLPETHAWFVHHVDNKHAVEKESKAARKHDHAPRKP
ncbi:MAG TPA: hypothetical protein VGD37_16680 [Kofleriaceae bacterium]|jgi:hypothetical protein